MQAGYLFKLTNAGDTHKRSVNIYPVGFANDYSERRMARHKKLILRDHPSDTKLLRLGIVTWSCVDVEILKSSSFRDWLGRQDSNLRMPAPKPVPAVFLRSCRVTLAAISPLPHFYSWLKGRASIPLPGRGRRLVPLADLGDPDE